MGRNATVSRVLLFASLVALASTAQAGDCDGNACGAVTMSFASGCYTLRNSDSSRRVKISLDPSTGIATSVSRDLNAGESWTVQQPFTSSCMGSIRLPYHANFL